MLATLSWALFHPRPVMFRLARNIGGGWLIGAAIGEMITRWFSG